MDLLELKVAEMATLIVVQRLSAIGGVKARVAYHLASAAHNLLIAALRSMDSSYRDEKVNRAFKSIDYAYGEVREEEKYGRGILDEYLTKTPELKK